ncbi:MAG: universal stress protein [Thermoproteus sp.]
MSELNIKTIVVAYDGSEHSKKALLYAISLARQTKAKLYLVYVVDTSLAELYSIPQAYDKIKKKGEELLAEARGSCAGLDAECKLLEGDPAEEIIKFAKDVRADLIVIGSRGLSRLKRILLGSVSARVATEAATSVLIVR